MELVPVTEDLEENRRKTENKEHDHGDNDGKAVVNQNVGDNHEKLGGENEKSPGVSDGKIYSKDLISWIPICKYIHETFHPPIILLWTYMTWYIWIVTNFPLPLYIPWMTSLVLSAFVGTALNANVYAPPFRKYVNEKRLAIVRFYVIPFCVSSYSNIGFFYKFVALFPVHNYKIGLIGVGITLGVALILSLARMISEKVLSSSGKTAPMEMP